MEEATDRQKWRKIIEQAEGQLDQPLVTAAITSIMPKSANRLEKARKVFGQKEILIAQVLL